MPVRYEKHDARLKWGLLQWATYWRLHVHDFQSKVPLMKINPAPTAAWLTTVKKSVRALVEAAGAAPTCLTLPSGEAKCYVVIAPPFSLADNTAGKSRSAAAKRCRMVRVVIAADVYHQRTSLEVR